MKKVLLCAVVLFFALTGAAFADRTAIEGAISAYEAIVVEAENVAKLPLAGTSDIAVIEQKATAAADQIKRLEGERELTIQDAKRSAELNSRFNQAMVIIVSQKLLKY
ncbi:MAG: hypothetical protein FWF55_07345 [Treponema sp.]|nr:hypothetical protein [Treponema sp.]